MKRTRRIRLSIMLWAAFLAISISPAVGYGEKCEQWVAKAVSVQGGVDVLKAGENQWTHVKLNDTFCPMDMVRVLRQSRADILLGNESILRLDQNTTVTFSKPETEKMFLMDLLEGMAYFFSRVRRSLKVVTPFVNAIVEGTEFVVRVEKDKTFVSLFEGKVALTNPAGSIVLSKGQSAIAEANRAPEFQVVMRPRDAVQWTLYYPPVLYYRPEDFPGLTESEQSMLRGSIEAYLQQNFETAFERIDGLPDQLQDPRLFTYRASLLLTVGRIDEAKADIDKALGIEANNSDALALLSIIAVAQNEKGKALDLAKKAVEADPRSTSARIALSYALQANFNLKGALDSLKDAVKLEPENGLAWARLSEMWLSFGNLNKALDAAKKAVELNPNLSRTQTVLGFAYLMEVKVSKAINAFTKAIEFDQADPLARLGLGLVKIRQGELEGGRSEIEIAMSLDPNNSLIRSYLGKAYFDEKRDELASNQFKVAKELDPKDPTPWFYDAIEKLTTNRPVEALNDVQKSIELNDNRAVYRSKLLLDEDLAARSAALGRIYNELGFQQVALVEGWKSVNTDPANYSAHRLLADSYSALPRHEIARVSELLQSQLLQPLNVTPVPAYIAEAHPSILEGAGPSVLSFNEFNPLFLRNRLALQASGVGGQKDSLGDDVVQSGVLGRVSYSLSQFHYESDGFRTNNDQEHDIYDAFLQVSITPKLSLQTEYRYKELQSGDLTTLFHSDLFNPDFRETDLTDSFRGGLHYSVSPRSDIIASIIYATLDGEQTIFPGIFSIDEKQHAYNAETQYLFREEQFDITSGIGHFNADDKTVISLSPNPPGIDKTHTKHTNVYTYLQLKLVKAATLTIGASADFYEGSEGNRTQVNPKVGLTWNLFPGTTVRAAYFRVLKRMMIGDQTIEPTQVAGFNQFFEDVNATKSSRYGVAVDQKLSTSLYAGTEFSRRDLRVPLTSLEPPYAVEDIPSNEKLARCYLYWTPASWLALKAEYQYEEFNLDPKGNNLFSASEIQTHRVPLGIGFFHPSGFILRLQPTYIKQHGKFANSMGEMEPGRSSFLTIDASVGYRLPKRWGFISVEAKNLFDKKSRFEDTDPENPRITPARTVLARITFSF